MKSSGLRVLAVIVFLLAFAGANVGSFLLGRASAEHNSVSWEEASVFYAQIVERRENTLLVEGLPVNDVNHRGQFSFTLGEDTRLLWRGEEITQEALRPGDTVAVTYSGETLEVYPVMLPQVYQVLLLEDENPRPCAWPSSARRVPRRACASPLPTSTAPALT